MNTYNILQPTYKFSHTFTPEPPAKPFDVFEISWKVVGTVKAPTIERALAYAKKAGWPAPAVESPRQAAEPVKPQIDFFAARKRVEASV
ncbi:MAG TPA: hypothetical protein PKV98_07830 [Burkholderiaceae bacterium]|nr:hypothetical protein [Burkholderiaceae bacterium]